MRRTYEIHLFGPAGRQHFKPAICDDLSQAMARARDELRAHEAERVELRFAGDLLFEFER